MGGIRAQLARHRTFGHLRCRDGKKSCFWYAKNVYLNLRPCSGRQQELSSCRVTFTRSGPDVRNDSPRRGRVRASSRPDRAGAGVSEALVPQRFGVSRTPAPEALSRLHQEGYRATTGSRVRKQLAVSPLTVE